MVFLFLGTRVTSTWYCTFIKLINNFLLHQHTIFCIHWIIVFYLGFLYIRLYFFSVDLYIYQHIFTEQLVLHLFIIGVWHSTCLLVFNHLFCLLILLPLCGTVHTVIYLICVFILVYIRFYPSCVLVNLFVYVVATVCI